MTDTSRVFNPDYEVVVRRGDPLLLPGQTSSSSRSHSHQRTGNTGGGGGNTTGGTASATSMHRLGEEGGKHDSQTMLSGGRKHSGDSNHAGAGAAGMGAISVMGAVATGTFLTGLVLFLVAFASTDWLGIEQGLALSLWRTCSKSYVDGDWRCEPWERIPVSLWRTCCKSYVDGDWCCEPWERIPDLSFDFYLWRTSSKSYVNGDQRCEPWERIPDFVRAAQGFCVVGLLTYAVSLVILVAYLAVPFLQETRGVLIALCLLTFSAGCMILMSLIVMGIKGRDFCDDIKRDDWTVLTYFAAGVDTLGPFYVGWSFVVAVIASLITLASFAFCMVEFIRVNDIVD